MHVHRLDRDTMELGDMEPLCCELLSQIVPSADVSDDPAAHRRLYSSPTEGHEPDFEQDWKSYVEPDLRDLFRNAQEIVQDDLRDFSPPASDAHGTVHIPLKHLEAWIHTLNQARLAIAARHDFTEKDMETRAAVVGDARSLALFQIHFYGFLQECFLQQLD